MTQNTEVGYITSSNNYLLHLNGLPSITIGELIENDAKERGLIHSLSGSHVQALMLDQGVFLPGDEFKRINQKLTVPVGDFLLGRAINPLGVPIDDKGLVQKGAKPTLASLDAPQRGVNSREFIKEQLVTGITVIDNVLPLGLGQRELIIGDSHSGIDDFLINLIVNLKGQSIVCIFCLIGKPSKQVKNLIESLKVNNALDYSVIVASTSTQSAPMIMLTAQSAFTIAEYFKDKGQNTLVILDDMGNLSNVYREISLLGGNPPGRESYPADSFYLSAHLLERAGKFNPTAGSGSITALPVMELNLNDFTGFIPTNLMAVTDGHLLFKSDLYGKNQRPAIDISQSVTRVGRQTQFLVNSLLSDRIKRVLSAAEELQTLSSLSQELPEESQSILKQKGLIEEIFKQDNLTFVPLPIQTILLGLVFTGFFKDASSLSADKSALIKALSKNEKIVTISKELPDMKSDEELIKALEGVKL